MRIHTHAISRMRERFCKKDGDSLEANPDVSEALVENVLGRLVKEGSVAKVGGGRSTAYVAL